MVLLAMAVVFQLPIFVLALVRARDPEHRDSCARTGGSATSSWSSSRSRCPASTRSRRSLEIAAAARPVRGLDLALRPHGTARARRRRRRYSDRPMARAAVKAKQQAAKQARQSARAAAVEGRAGASRRRPAKARARRQSEPALFFMLLRRRAKYVFVAARRALRDHVRVPRRRLRHERARPALLGPQHLRRQRHLRSRRRRSYIKEHPNAQGYRDLATAYEAKSDTDDAIAALQRYTRIKPKDAKAWRSSAGSSSPRPATCRSSTRARTPSQQLAAPSTPFLPTGKLGQAVGQSPIEQAAAQQAGHGGHRPPAADAARATTTPSSSYDQAATLAAEQLERLVPARAGGADRRRHDDGDQRGTSAT